MTSWYICMHVSNPSSHMILDTKPSNLLVKVEKRLAKTTKMWHISCRLLTRSIMVDWQTYRRYMYSRLQNGHCSFSWHRSQALATYVDDWMVFRRSTDKTKVLLVGEGEGAYLWGYITSARPCTLMGQGFFPDKHINKILQYWVVLWNSYHTYI